MTKEAKEFTDALIEGRFEVCEEWLGRIQNSWGLTIS